MRLDQIAYQYCKDNNLEGLYAGMPGDIHEIYELYKNGNTYKPLKIEHPLNRIQAVINALGRSNLFYCNSYLVSFGHRYNYYRLVENEDVCNKE